MDIFGGVMSKIEFEQNWRYGCVLLWISSKIGYTQLSLTFFTNLCRFIIQSKNHINFLNEKSAVEGRKRAL